MADTWSIFGVELSPETWVVLAIGLATVAAQIAGIGFQWRASNRAADVAARQVEAANASIERELAAVLVASRVGSTEGAGEVWLQNVGLHPAINVKAVLVYPAAAPPIAEAWCAAINPRDGPPRMRTRCSHRCSHRANATGASSLQRVEPLVVAVAVGPGEPDAVALPEPSLPAGAGAVDEAKRCAAVPA